MKLLRNLYDWVIHWSSTRYAVPALFLLSFIESSVFPIPPDVLLMAMSVSVPKRAFYYAFVCSSASVLGGMFGYFIGLEFMDVIGNRIVEFYHLQDKFQQIGILYEKYEAWAVAGAGFTPIPYKVFTIAAGAFEINFLIFVLASIAGRSLRFFLIGGLIFKFGEPIKSFIDKYFNVLSIVFFVMLILGFYLIKYLL